MDILPADNDTFITKKGISEKQKLHLERAREASRRKAQAKINVNQVVENEEEEDLEEKEQEPPKQEPVKTKKVITKPKPKKVNKEREDEKYRLTEEEIAERKDLETFEKFMKQMSKYEDLKEKIKEEEEDKKKIHIKYSQEEYDELLAMLKEQETKEETNRQELQNKNIKPKQKDKYRPPPITRSHALNTYLSSSHLNKNRNRFGV